MIKQKITNAFEKEQKNGKICLDNQEVIVKCCGIKHLMYAIISTLMSPT